MKSYKAKNLLQQNGLASSDMLHIWVSSLYWLKGYKKMCTTLNCGLYTSYTIVGYTG